MKSANCLNTVVRSSQNPMRRMLISVRKALMSNRGHTTAAVVELLAGLLLLPVDYQVSCESEIQPGWCDFARR